MLLPADQHPIAHRHRRGDHSLFHPVLGQHFESAFRLDDKHNAIFARGVPEYSRIGLVRSRELGDLLAQVIGSGTAAMMRGHGMTTAFADVRTATVAAIYLEESAALQLRMLSATGGDALRLRVYTAEEAGPLADQIAGNVARRAWEYFAAIAARNPLGSGQK